MSSKAGKIATEIKKSEEALFEELSASTLMGSIVRTFAMLTDTTPKASRGVFNLLKESCENKTGIFADGKDMSIKELTNKVWEIFDPAGDYESMKDYVFLFTDKNQFYSPLVAPVVNDKILPLHKLGIYYGIHNSFINGLDYAQAEPLFKELKNVKTTETSSGDLVRHSKKE